MRILILGSDNLAHPLRALGHEVMVCGPDPGTDLALAAQDPDWREIERALAARGMKADAILVTDHVGRRRLPTGLWAAEAVTAFYGVDSPLNRFWQWPYARLFDMAWLDQPEEAQGLSRHHPCAAWLPVGIDLARYEGLPKGKGRAGVCFVGVVDERLRPKRSAVLKRVAKAAPLTVRGGRREKWFPTKEAARLYRRHFVTINENLFPGFTTRPLEVMASGGFLLSEAAEGSMDRHFVGGRHLGYFGPDDLEQKLEFYLGDDAARSRVAEAGREAVTSGHTLAHRAAEIVRRLQETARMPQAKRARAKGSQALNLEGRALMMAGLRWPAEDGIRRLLRAEGRTQAATQNGADPLFAARAAGLCLAATAKWDQALSHLKNAAQGGHPGDRLTLALAAKMSGRGQAAADALKALKGDYPGLTEGPGRAGFHLEAARLLMAEGRDLSPGFSRRGLSPIFWTACEHLQEAVAQEPSLAQAWEELGDLLLKRGGANQAHQCYQRARQLSHTTRLAAKEAQAAKEGYLT